MCCRFSRSSRLRNSPEQAPPPRSLHRQGALGSRKHVCSEITAWVGRGEGPGSAKSPSHIKGAAGLPRLGRHRKSLSIILLVPVPGLRLFMLVRNYQDRLTELHKFCFRVWFLEDRGSYSRRLSRDGSALGCVAFPLGSALGSEVPAEQLPGPPVRPPTDGPGLAKTQLDAPMTKANPSKNSCSE